MVEGHLGPHALLVVLAGGDLASDGIEVRPDVTNAPLACHLRGVAGGTRRRRRRRRGRCCRVGRDLRFELGDLALQSRDIGMLGQQPRLQRRQPATCVEKLFGRRRSRKSRRIPAGGWRRGRRRGDGRGRRSLGRQKIPERTLERHLPIARAAQRVIQGLELHAPVLERLKIGGRL